MSGHSKWSSIKHKKGAADAKRGRLFTRLIKEITVAARLGGGDPASNPRLRQAVQAAKNANMPQDNINRGIKKGTGELEGVHYEEVTYEGYGPGGAAIFVEAVTDNKNRTVGELRALFGKNGGNLGESGCVAWIFDQRGMVTVPATGKSEEEVFEIALEAGAEDLNKEDDEFQILTSVEKFESVRKALEDRGLPIKSAELTRLPQNTTSIEDEKNSRRLLKLLDALEDHDDVQKVYSNYDIPDAVLVAIGQES